MFVLKQKVSQIFFFFFFLLFPNINYHTFLPKVEKKGAGAEKYLQQQREDCVPWKNITVLPKMYHHGPASGAVAFP